MTDLSGILLGAEGDGVQWAVETPGGLKSTRLGPEGRS